MPSFAYGYASGSEARTLVNTLLAQIGDVSAGANLGFLYATDALARELPQILQLLKSSTGVAHWTGAVGMAINVQGRELYDQPAIAVMLGEFADGDFLMLPNQSSGVSTFLEQNEAWLNARQPRFAVLHGDPSNPATPTLMQNLSASLDGAFCVGGLASSNSQLLQVADEIVAGGLSGVLFAPEVEVAAGHTQGCSPIGPVHTVTRAHRNIIAELDEHPALDIMKQDIGEVLARDLSRLGGYIFVGLPLARSDTGDYLVRNLLGIDVGQGLIAIGDMIGTGDQVLFCRRDGNTAREDMLRMLENLKRRCGDAAPRGGLYFSCLGRGRHQFGDDSEEMRMITEVLGDFPLVGFFANGEIFHDRLYGYTGVLNLFL